jgi:hypothetical protein
MYAHALKNVVRISKNVVRISTNENEREREMRDAGCIVDSKSLLKAIEKT